MNQETQEALSRKYSNEIILLLPLSTGNFAIFNSARELCGIFSGDLDCYISKIWFSPAAPAVILVESSTEKSLEDLGL